MAKLFKFTSLMAIIACLLWSSAFASIKIGLQYTTPLKFAGIRFLIAGLLVLPFCGKLLAVVPIIMKNYRTILLVAVLQTSLLYTLFYLGLELLPGAIAAIIIGTQPLIIALAAHFVSGTERMTRRKAISLALGLTGVSVIAFDRGELSIEGGMELIGIGLLLLSNMSAAMGNLMVAKKTAKIPPLVLNSTQLIVGGLLLLLLSFAVEDGVVTSYPAEYYYSLAWLSVLSALALSIWFNLLKLEGVNVSDLNIWKFLIPLSGACFSWLLLDGESPDVATLAGMITIAISLLILNMPGRIFNRSRVMQ